jgi:hypothetical protein
MKNVQMILILLILNFRSDAQNRIHPIEGYDTIPAHTDTLIADGKMHTFTGWESSDIALQQWMIDHMQDKAIVVKIGDQYLPITKWRWGVQAAKVEDDTPAPEWVKPYLNAWTIMLAVIILLLCGIGALLYKQVNVIEW